MPGTRHVSRRRNGKEAVTVLGAVGISLSLAGGASAATAVPAMKESSRPVAPGSEITLSDEEVADVSLATFYVFDKESENPPHGWRFAGGGCRGCTCFGTCSASGVKDTWEMPVKPARRGAEASGSKRRFAPD